MKKQEAVKKLDPEKETPKQEPIKQEPKAPDSDPYDRRVICPATPKCCVVGDPLDYPIECTSEESDNV